MNINEAILNAYPKAKDCLSKGYHFGQPKYEMHQEEDDDRYIGVKVIRCGHCNMVMADLGYMTSKEVNEYYEATK